MIGLFCVLASHCCVSSDVRGLDKKLKAMEKSFPLPYHEALQANIKKCATEAVPCNFEQYSSFIETELRKRSIPLEMKYLPFALSKMNPNFREGDRRGYWSLPTVVGLRYGLVIDGENDQRLDLEASSRAALDYLAELNAKYHNWWLSILAFSNSANALHHAIMLSDEIPELWDFYEDELLPNTLVISNLIGYIYLGNEGQITFSEPIQPIAPTPKMQEPEIQPAVAEKNQNDDNQQVITTTPPVQKTQPDPSSKPKVTYYTVKRGDTLTKIAKQFHVTVNNLMKWNNLKNDKIYAGQKLIVKK